jgi:hypothetical protein
MKVDVYGLRHLLGRRDGGAALSPAEERKLLSLSGSLPALPQRKLDIESRCAWVVSMYRALGEKTGMKRLLKEIVSAEDIRGGWPLLALPDLVEAAKEAGIWDRAAQRWQAAAIEKGLLNFNMLRPGE